MAFDQPTRNRLARFVGDARRILTDEFTRQCKQDYGIDPDTGEISDVARLVHLNDGQRATARILRDTIDHYVINSPSGGKRVAIERIIREQAFTVLNRLCAVRMAEARDILIQSVGKGYQSKGFQLYTRVAGSSLGEVGEAYCSFLFSVFDEIATDFPSLFDRFSKQGRLFPGENALLRTLEEINRPDIDPLWAEDETIGWLYQYFNSVEERKKMRDDSPAPRDSRELAVRNQFFTPRYVVEFLVDNTLGRIWYEMTGGQTDLRNRCRYLVRRPDEVFLAEPDTEGVRAAQAWLQSGAGERPDLWQLAHAVKDYAHAGQPGEESNEWVAQRIAKLAPEAVGTLGTQELLELLLLFCRKERCCEGTLAALKSEIDVILGEVEARTAAARQPDHSQEQVLRKPVYTPQRPLKDPREIRLLDPACGSMHFGLYAFDLFTAIYDEAWDIAHGPDPDEATKSTETFAPFIAFAASFADKVAFLHEVPRLIVENNIHGIDIDPRAVQIAGLSLWLRAQRAWQQSGVKPADRPRISRSNLVCAEPMPGETRLLGEFIQRQFPPGERAVFGFLLEKVFNCMKLAGEAGTLLRVEEEIRAAVAEAKSLWQQVPRLEQQLLFIGASEPSASRQMQLDLSGITDKQFWGQAEQRIYGALRAYAEQAESGGGFQRRLFADDAAQGFAFIDLCQKRYDVVVMNPPFGESVPSFKKYASEHFARSKADMLCMFVERVTELLAPDCFCAAITNRTPFFTDGTEAWREAFCLGGAATSIRLFADLGHKVLDSALVETAAYSLTRASNQRELSWFNVTQVTDKESSLLMQIQRGGGVAKLDDIEAIPGKRLSYWLPSSVIRCYAELPSLAGSVESVDKGMSTTDDYRFIRTFWEVPEAPSTDAWMYYSKGGEYSPFASDIHLTVNWRNGGQEISEIIVAKYPYLNGDAGWVLHPETHHGSPGLTYTKRTTSSFSARFLSAGARVSDLANLVYDSDMEKLLGALVCLSTSPFHYLLDAAVPSIDSSAGGTAARHYEVGTLREVPVPAANLQHHADVGRKLFRFAQQRYVADEATTSFRGLPGICAAATLKAASADEEIEQLKTHLDAIDLHAQAERTCIADYGLDDAAVEAVYDYMGPHPADLPKAGLLQLLSPEEVWKQAEEQLTSLLVRTYGGKRRFSKQTWVSSRDIELWAFVTNLAPAQLAHSLAEDASFVQRNSRDFTTRIASYLFGTVFGRWDIRFATGMRPAPELPDPFAPLPACPPGMLQGDDGLPLLPGAGRRLRTEGQYPLDVAWEGILIDDPEHALDVERRVRAALAVIWGERADAIEHEACTLLGVRRLRDWFRKPVNFFADHLKRYSKSRRQAPIYWPLSTPSCSYTLWIYYHRLSDQTLFTAVNDFVEPKLVDVSREASRLRSKANRSGEEEIALEEAADLEKELREFRDELLRIAKFWKPNLNDGVQITAAPLWKMFQLKPWQKKLKETWEALEAGDYDWAHLAYSIWPDRVRTKCRTDKSLAIAHGLEDLYQQAPATAKKKRGRKAKPEESQVLEDGE